MNLLSTLSDLSGRLRHGIGGGARPLMLPEPEQILTGIQSPKDVIALPASPTRSSAKDYVGALVCPIDPRTFH